MLNKKKLRKYVITFRKNRVTVGFPGKKPFIDTKVDCPLKVKYIGVASGYGSDADWKFCGYGKLSL